MMKTEELKQKLLARSVPDAKLDRILTDQYTSGKKVLAYTSSVDAALRLAAVWNIRPAEALLRPIAGLQTIETEICWIARGVCVQVLVKAKAAGLYYD